MNVKSKTMVYRVKPSVVFLLLGIFFGGAIRLMPVLNSNFPLNDGGLFFTMTKDLIAEGFRIPDFTSYNHLEIPFVYPPLGFYMAGGINEVTGWDLLDVFRFLPAIFSILAIPAFYFLAKTISSNEFSLGLSVLMFSFLPPTVEWVIMGGGITRAPGFLFSLLALRSGYLLFFQKKKKNIILTAIFSSITILFHPEAAVHTAAGIFVFFLFSRRYKEGLLKSIIVAILILLLTSFWWLSIVANHGFSPFTAAGTTGLHNVNNLLNFILFNFTQEKGLTITGVFALIGIFLFMSKKRMMILCWFLVTFVAGPRSAPLYLAPIIALLAGTVLTQILMQIDDEYNRKKVEADNRQFLSGKISKIFLTILILHWSISGLITVYDVLTIYTLSQSDIKAMEWVKENVSTDKKFLILSGISPFRDATSEWFPTITKRISVATIQGHEWINDYDFNEKMENFSELQKCTLETLDCIDEWENESKLGYDYIYLRKYVYIQNYGNIPTDALLNSLLGRNGFTLVYETDSVLVFKRIDF